MIRFVQNLSAAAPLPGIDRQPKAPPKEGAPRLSVLPQTYHAETGHRRWSKISPSRRVFLVWLFFFAFFFEIIFEKKKAKPKRFRFVFFLHPENQAPLPLSLSLSFSPLLLFRLVPLLLFAVHEDKLQDLLCNHPFLISSSASPSSNKQTNKKWPRCKMSSVWLSVMAPSERQAY